MSTCHYAFNLKTNALPARKRGCIVKAAEALARSRQAIHALLKRPHGEEILACRLRRVGRDDLARFFEETLRS